MSQPLTFLGILAHPDDESLGMGGTFTKYAKEGIDTYLICATRGERGRFGTEKKSPGIEIVGRTREKELREAAKILGIKEIFFLDYLDADLDKADTNEVLKKIVPIIRKLKPQVVASFGPDGGYGHPDHVAISQLSGASIVSAANLNFSGSESLAPHGVSKFYYMTWNKDIWEAYQSAFKKLVSNVDGYERQANPWPDWAITTEIDASAYWETVWKAICCHQTQMEIYGELENLPEKTHKILWGSQQFYRVFSTVNGGRTKENDLFAGLR